MKLCLVLSLSLFLTCCHGFVGNLGFQGMMRRPPMPKLGSSTTEENNVISEGDLRSDMVNAKQAKWYQKLVLIYHKFLKNINVFKDESKLIPLLKDKIRI